MQLEDDSGKTVDLSKEDIEAKFNAVKDATQQDLPAPPRKQRTPKPERKPAPRTKSPRQAREKTAPAPVTPALNQARAKKVTELLTIVSGSLLVAGKARDSIALRADGHAVAALTPQLSEAVVSVAAHDPAVARLLDNEGSARAAAYVGLVAVSFSLGSQVAANHNYIKPGTMNTASAEDIVAAFEQEENASGGTD